MKLRAARLVPVQFKFSDAESRAEGWGRLVELSANGAQLMTRFKLSKGERVHLNFKLAEEEFEALWARVTRVDNDLDGYVVADLNFVDPQLRQRLGRVLQEILTRTS